MLLNVNENNNVTKFEKNNKQVKYRRSNLIIYEKKEHGN